MLTRNQIMTAGITIVAIAILLRVKTTRDLILGT